MLSIMRTLGALSIVLETEAGSYKAALSSSHGGSQGSPNSSQAGTILNAIYSRKTGSV